MVETVIDLAHLARMTLGEAGSEVLRHFDRHAETPARAYAGRLLPRPHSHTP